MAPVDTFAHLRIEGLPAGAHITIDGVAAYSPSIDIDLKAEKSRIVQLAVTKDGYVAYRASVPLTRGAVSTLKVSMAVDTVAHIVLAGVPDGANVTVDGTVYLSTPIDIDLGANATRTVDIKVEKAGLLPFEQQVALTRGAETDVTVSMAAVPVDTKAHLRLAGVPNGATITIDGVVYPGASIDMDLGAVTTRTVDVKVDKIGLTPFDEQVTLKRGAESDVAVSMAAVPVDTKAHLRLAGVPSGATITVDGAVYPRASIDIDLGADPTRTVAIAVTKDGYTPYASLVLLTRGAVSRVPISMALLPPPITPTPVSPPVISPPSTPAPVPAPPNQQQGFPVGVNPGDQTTNQKDGAVMVWVPAGDFTMGSDDSEVAKQDNPPHTVTLDGYWIYKTPVTVAQYQAFCAATGAHMPKSPDWGWQHSDYPMVRVKWSEAVAYAKWAGVSLPTEAQWEKAACGKLPTLSYKYPWGFEWDPSKCENSVGGNLNHPVDVGSYPSGASPYGALDMAGNVFEWCSDWYAPDYYTQSPEANPTGPSGGMDRVERGGGYDNNFEDTFACAHRGYEDPTSGYIDVGFRCVARPN